MHRIQWTGLPPALRDHLFDRLRERKITAEDLYQLKAWRESEPEAPDGLWYWFVQDLRRGKIPENLFARGPAREGAEALSVVGLSPLASSFILPPSSLFFIVEEYVLPRGSQFAGELTDGLTVAGTAV